MEIIPVIYTALFIVVALTIIALSVSLISSKLKHSKASEIQKSNTVSSPSSGPVKINSPMKPLPDNSESSPILRQNELRPEPRKNEQVLSPNADEWRDKPSHPDPKKDNSHKRPAQRNYTRDQSEPCDEKPKILNDRISVLKNLTPRNIQKETSPKVKPEPLAKNKKALGDDILGNYMEDDHKDMFTLKVKKDNDNQDQDD